jgi:hypothetical protein
MKRQQALESENALLKAAPEINKSKEYPNTFYDRQMILLSKY